MQSKVRRKSYVEGGRKELFCRGDNNIEFDMDVDADGFVGVEVFVDVDEFDVDDTDEFVDVVAPVV